MRACRKRSRRKWDTQTVQMLLFSHFQMRRPLTDERYRWKFWKSCELYICCIYTYTYALPICFCALVINYKIIIIIRIMIVTWDKDFNYTRFDRYTFGGVAAGDMTSIVLLRVVISWPIEFSWSSFIFIDEEIIFTCHRNSYYCYDGCWMPNKSLFWHNVLISCIQAESVRKLAEKGSNT